MDTRPDTMSNIASYYGVNSKTLQRHYKHKVSGFKEWNQLPHAEDYFIYPENITDRLSIDEVSLSNGELYTFVTNKNSGVKNKQSAVVFLVKFKVSFQYENSSHPLSRSNAQNQITYFCQFVSLRVLNDMNKV
ncbi:MAG: hypothetical protein H7141_11300 [Burkholderiales bacterium]|nr:hypothetical protein [Bacteroidia bacterium]